MSKKETIKLVIHGFGPPPLPVDPHPGKAPSATMEPVVKAATGEKTGVSLWDLFDH
jgi:hypothetical protein